MKNAIELTSGIVIARSDLRAASSAELTTLITSLNTKSKPVRVVDNIQHFFSTKNLDSALQDADVGAVEMIAEKRGFVVTEEELAYIKAFKSFRSQIASRERLIPVKYDFAPVPDGWTVESKLIISKSTVGRRDGNYSIGLKTLAGLWVRAAKVWSGDTDAATEFSLRASGYSRTAVINPVGITIGCQSIKRFELEQLAVNRGWQIPG